MTGTFLSQRAKSFQLSLHIHASLFFEIKINPHCWHNHYWHPGLTKYLARCALLLSFFAHQVQVISVSSFITVWAEFICFQQCFPMETSMCLCEEWNRKKNILYSLAVKTYENLLGKIKSVHASPLTAENRSEKCFMMNLS